MLSGDQYVTCSAAYPAICGLFAHLQRTRETTKLPIIGTMCDVMMEDFTARHQPSDILVVAAYLDGRFKKFPSEDRLNQARAACLSLLKMVSLPGEGVAAAPTTETVTSLRSQSDAEEPEYVASSLRKIQSMSPCSLVLSN
jgi:hypothetical protein